MKAAGVLAALPSLARHAVIDKQICKEIKGARAGQLTQDFPPSGCHQRREAAPEPFRSSGESSRRLRGQLPQSPSCPGQEYDRKRALIVQSLTSGDSFTVEHPIPHSLSHRATVMRGKPSVRGQRWIQAIRGWPGIHRWPGYGGPSMDPRMARLPFLDIHEWPGLPH